LLAIAILLIFSNVLFFGSGFYASGRYDALKDLAFDDGDGERASSPDHFFSDLRKLAERDARRVRAGTPALLLSSLQ